MLKDLLSIVLITYNRAKPLQRTLRNLMSSQLNDVPITVLNNHSTDNTLEVCQEFSSFDNFNVVTHKFNIGGGANIMRAYEYATTPYVWIMSDDDYYDFSKLDDLESAMRSNKYNVIQIGCTDAEDFYQFAGYSGCIKDLIKSGYNYFRLSSNIVCSIIKVDALTPYIRQGYDNVVNYYPHMPYLIAQFENNAEIYISQNKILSIYIGATDNYDYTDFVGWWIETSRYLKSNKDRQDFIMSQFSNDTKHEVVAGMFLKYLKRKSPSLRTVMYIYHIMPVMTKVLAPFAIPKRYIQVIRDKRKENK